MTLRITSYNRDSKQVDSTARETKSFYSGLTHQISFDYDSITSKLITEGYEIETFSFVWFKKKERQKRIKRDYVNWKGDLTYDQLLEFIAQLKINTDSSGIKQVPASHSGNLHYISFEIIQNADTTKYTKTAPFEHAHWSSSKGHEVVNFRIDNFLHKILPSDFFYEKTNPNTRN